MRFSFARAIGWGIVIYATMYLSWGFLLAYGLQGTTLARIILLGVLLVSSTVAARMLPVRLPRDILPYSFSWGIVIALIDLALSAPSGSWQIFADPNLWVGYILVIIVPLILPRTIHAPQVPHMT